MMSISFSKNWLYQKASNNSKAACVSQFSETSFSFHRAIEEVVDAYGIPDDLVINMDQRPLPFILLSIHTMNKQNQKLVPRANSADIVK